MGEEFEKETFENESNKTNEVKLKSRMFNNDNEKLLEKREEETNDAVMWGFVIGFALFLVLMIIIIVFTQI